jgi:hypothetical protein
MRSGYYDGELDQYVISNSSMMCIVNDRVYISQRGLGLIIVSHRINGRRTYKMEIIISPNGNTTWIDWDDGDDIYDVIMKPSYSNFIYNNIERIISDGSELELGRFIHTEFVKLVEYDIEHGNTNDYVFGQLPTKK